MISTTFRKSDEVNNYEIDSTLKVKLKSPIQNVSNSVAFKGIIDEENDEVNVEVIERENNTENKQRLIVKDNKQYLHKDGEWETFDEPITDFKKSGTTYYNIVETVDDFDPYANVIKENGMYKATYKGSAEEVFYVFQDVFNLTLTGADLEEDTTMDVEALFDEKAMFMTSLFIKLDAESPAGDMSIQIDVDFNDMNETTVTLPDDLDIIE